MKILSNILDWLMPRDFRSYWSHWFILAYFGVGCAMYCPQVIKAMAWPFIMILQFFKTVQ